MKNLILIGLMGIGIVSLAQSKEEVIKKEYTFEQKNQDNVFQLSNVNGFIKVEVHDNDKFVLEVRTKITAKKEERLELGMKEIGISQ